MKIMVKNIPAEGLEFTQDVSPASIGLEGEDFKCLSLLMVKAKVERIRNTVIANVETKAKYSFICARCLEEMDYFDEADYRFEYMVEPHMVSIDVGDDIRQEIILGLPMKVLCREDCKGLCPTCGVNLNKENCVCEKKL